MTPEEELQRAHEAQQVLGSSVFQEACTRIDEGLTAQRRAVPLTATEMHTALILTEQLWGNVRNWIEQVAQTGKFAQIELDRQRTLRQRAEETVRIWRKAR